AQAGEARISNEVPAREIERPRYVLDVHGVLPRGGLEPERAERLQIALQRHQVEAPPELLGVARPCLPAVAEREEEGNQPLDLRLGEIDVRVAEQRDQVVGVGAEPRILEV